MAYTASMSTTYTQPAVNPGQRRCTPHYTSIRAWLDHLRVTAELPYPSWALMPLLTDLIHQKVPGTVFSFAWFCKTHSQPLALWVDPVNATAYRGFMAHHERIFSELPLSVMLATRGRIIRDTENHPTYVESTVYREVFVPYNIHWGMAVPVHMSGSSNGIMNICRPRDRGAFSDSDWQIWDQVAAALADLDRPSHPMSGLPAAPFCREAKTTSLWLGNDGQFLAQGARTCNLLFLAQCCGMASTDWMLPDVRALPAEVRSAVEILFSSNEPSGCRELSLIYPWGRFDFILEKMAVADHPRDARLSVVIHYHEPLDVAVARALWTWPLSPQEKRILIASARHPTESELAQALGLTVGTLKNYINKLQARLGMASREEIIDAVLASHPGIRTTITCNSPVTTGGATYDRCHADSG